MQANVFYAKPQNGFIPIPDEYKEQIMDEVMVIALEKKPLKINRKEANTRRKSDLLLPPTLDTRDWVFNREEAEGTAEQTEAEKRESAQEWLDDFFKILSTATDDLDEKDFPRICFRKPEELFADEGDL